MLNIRAAKRAEYEAVKDFYDSLIDSMENSPFHPGWEKGIYPAYEYLMDSIKKGQLYCGWLEGQIVSCMIVNHEYNEGYPGAELVGQSAGLPPSGHPHPGSRPPFCRKGHRQGNGPVRHHFQAREQKIPTIRLGRSGGKYSRRTGIPGSGVSICGHGSHVL